MKTVVGIDVGFRTGAMVALRSDGSLSYTVLSTPPPPPKRARRPGELVIADDQSISELFRQTVAVLKAFQPQGPRGEDFGQVAVVYEIPGKGQGARAVEALAFARSATICACSMLGVEAVGVTPEEVQRALLGPPGPRPPILRKPGKAASQATLDAFALAKKAQKKAKDKRRSDRKRAIADRIGALFPELSNLEDATADWSHVVDAAAVVFAELAIGKLTRTMLDGSEWITRLVGKAAA